MSTPQDVRSSASTTKTMRLQNLRLVLRADSGLSVGKFYPLDEVRNILGRRLDVHVPLEDVKASREHAVIDIQNGFYILSDLSSTNGTFINGQRVQEPARLRVGDRIRVGNTTFVLDLYENARARDSKRWDEPTRITQRPPVELDVLSRKPEKTSSKNRWNVLMINQKDWIRDFSAIRVIHGKQTLLMVIVLLILAAVLIQLRLPVSV